MDIAKYGFLMCISLELVIKRKHTLKSVFFLDEICYYINNSKNKCYKNIFKT